MEESRPEKKGGSHLEARLRGSTDPNDYVHLVYEPAVIPEGKKDDAPKWPKMGVMLCHGHPQHGWLLGWNEGENRWVALSDMKKLIPLMRY